MADLHLDADLLVDDAGAKRQLSTTDLSAQSTGAAREGTLASAKIVLDAISSALSGTLSVEEVSPVDVSALATAVKQDASRVVLEAVRDAVQGTVAVREQSPLDLSALATGAKQDAAQARLDALASEAKLEAVRLLLAGTLSVQEATPLDLSALSTAAKQDAAKAVLDTLGTEVTLAGLEAKAATAGKQDTMQARLDLLATEAKLETVRALLASLDGKDYATETTLATVRQEAGHGSTRATPSYVSSTDVLGEDIAAGRLFVAGSPIDLGSGQVASIHLDNPADSGVVVTVLGFSAYSNNTTSMRVRFVRDGTSSGDLRTPQNHHFGSPAVAQAVIRAGEGALSGGTQLSASARVVRDDHFSYKGAPLILPPGSSAGMDMTSPSGLGSSTASDLNVTWREMPL